jgi:hypothetical protein
MLLPDPSPAEAADIVAIHRLAVSYSEAICRGALDEAVQVYARDGVLASATTADAVGHEAIVATIRRATGGFDFVFQTTHAGLVSVSTDVGRARFPTTEWARKADGEALQFLGVYEDDLVRTADGWRFARRTLHGLSLGRVDSFRTSRTHPLGMSPWG